MSCAMHEGDFGAWFKTGHSRVTEGPWQEGRAKGAVALSGPSTASITSSSEISSGFRSKR